MKSKQEQIKELQQFMDDLCNFYGVSLEMIKNSRIRGNGNELSKLRTFIIYKGYYDMKLTYIELSKVLNVQIVSIREVVGRITPERMEEYNKLWK